MSEEEVNAIHGIMRKEDCTTALDFARMVSPPGINFGLTDRDHVIQQLRLIADRMEKDEKPKIVMQEAHSAVHTYNEDFMHTTLVLDFVEMLPTAKPGTKLYGSSQFPVEVKGIE